MTVATSSPHSIPKRTGPISPSSLRQHRTASRWSTWITVRPRNGRGR